jgi:8-oxo-dGTP diphosphatase
MPNTEADSPETAATVRVQVAAAAIFDQQGRVLITRRADHVHQGGLWEFPGGKLEPDETAREALTRELREELGIELHQARPLIRVSHDYPDKSVLLDVWRVDGFGGEAHGREGQPLVWVLPQDLGDYDFPAANQAIVCAVQLPAFYLITPNPGDDTPGFLAQLERRLGDGIRLVQLRAKSLPESDYIALAKQCLLLCEKYHATLMLNADPAMVMAVGAHGVHLDSGRLESLSERPNVKWMSASCHSQQQLAQAQKLGADFVMLSPVAATASHPDTVPLGWEKFQSLAEQVSCPVFALGGMSPDDLPQAFAHGAQGVAAIRALWSVE